MKLKLSIIAAIFSLAIIFQSCCQDVVDFFNILDLEIILIKSSTTDTRFEILRENDIMDFTTGNLQVQLDYQIEYISEDNLFNSLQLNNFITPVYGTSCEPPGALGSKEEMLSEVTIVTINDFNEDYKAGDTINNLFAVLGNFSAKPPLDEYILANQNTNIMEENLLLELTTRPSFDHDLIFDIKVELSTDEKFEMQTFPILVEL